MQSVLQAILIAIIAFASTDIDDLVVVSAFFADRSIAGRAVVAGQFAGIATLTAISAVAALLALAIPPGWISLLGLAPLGMGLVKLRGLWVDRAGDPGGDADAEEHRIEARTHSQWLAVAAVTIANGGDNLGVFIPLFASNLVAVPLYAAVFAAMTALWCLLGFLLVANRLAAAVVRRWGHVVLPFVLIGIGVRILWRASAIWAGG